MLLGYARGKVGSLVFARLKGQQITRAYNPSPNDRKTNKQMTQRVKLPALVAFYQQNKSFFPFSFTSKKATQSDYNAFVSANLKLADVPYYDKGLIAKGYPVVGPYLGTDGAVSEVACSFGYLQNGAGEGGINTAVGVKTSIIMPSDFTFGKFPMLGTFAISEFSQAVIAQNPDIQNGDMLTFYLVAWPSVLNGGVIDVNQLNIPNIIASCQITLDVNSQESAVNFGLKFAYKNINNNLYLLTNNVGNLCMASKPFADVQGSSYKPTDFETSTYANLAMSVCCVVSRNTGVQQVSRSRFALSPVAETYYQKVNSSASMANAILSYGATGEALLENKQTSFISGKLTAKTVPFGDNTAGVGNCIIDLSAEANPQYFTIDSLTECAEPFKVELYVEGGETPYATFDNVSFGQRLRVPAGYGLYLVSVVQQGITTSSGGSVTAEYYE